MHSDQTITQYSNFTGSQYNIAQFSNANQTYHLINNITLTYPQPFGQVIVNLTNNPGLQATITQIAGCGSSFYITSNVVPAAPCTRLLIKSNLSDAQYFTLIPNSLNPSTIVSLQGIYNNYNVAPYSNTMVVGNVFNIYMAQSNYNNLVMSIYNSTFTSQAGSHYPAVNNFCPMTLTSAQSASWPLYLTNLNGSEYTFTITLGGGQYAVNYTMVVQEGATVSLARQVQSYKIRNSQGGFTLALENGQQYRFLFYGLNCTLVYTSALTQWPQSIGIQLPTNVSLPKLLLPTYNVTCNTYLSGNTNEWVVCSGQDGQNLMSSWDISANYRTYTYTNTIQTNTVTGASFYWNWTVPNRTKHYVIVINGTYGSLDNVIPITSYPVNNGMPPIPTTSYGITGVMLLLTMIFANEDDLRGAIICAIAGLLFGAYAGIYYNLYLDVFVALALLAAMVIFMVRNSKGE